MGSPCFLLGIGVIMGKKKKEEISFESQLERITPAPKEEVSEVSPEKLPISLTIINMLVRASDI